MRIASLLGPDLKAVLASDPESVREALEDVRPEDIAEVVAEFEDDEALALLALLLAETAAAVLEHVPTERQAALFEKLSPEHAVPLVREMSADDRVDLIQGLPDEVAKPLLERLEEHEPEVAEEVRKLTAWPEDTAGGLMTTEFAGFPPDWKVWEAIEQVRRLAAAGELEALDPVYVTGYGEKLLGAVPLRDMILADPSKALEDVMTEDVLRVLATDDQERVAEQIAKYDLASVPVVDEQGRMLGVVTVDDVVDVVIEEATEDAHKMGGVVPLEDTYLGTGLLEFVWKRGVWLSVLFIGQLLTANVMETNEGVLTSMIELAVFVPTVIASGGNAGAQSSSLVIRALAVGEVRPHDWWRVLAREVAIGLALGLFLGTIGFVRALVLGESVSALRLAWVVGASVAAVVIAGNLIGSILPMLIRRLGFDPAVGSTPFVASIVDVVGLVVYFTIARFAFAL